MRVFKTYLFLIQFFYLPVFFAQTLTGIVNVYTSVSGICQSEITVASTAGFAAGDKVLLIQMRGADIDVTNTASFGDITSLNSAGRYEFLTVMGISGSIIYTTTNPQFSYNITGQVQLVKVSYHTSNITIGAAGVTCPAWNGLTGGVVVIETTAALTFAGNIDVSGRGFRGGNDLNAAWGCVAAGTYDYFYAIGSTLSGPKGEGIAAQFLTTSNGEGRGKAANGGGAGNNVNAGGGGGSNGAVGGFGGREWASCSGPSPLNTRGIGGLSMSTHYSNTINRIFMGGGGGSGHAGANVSGGGQGANGGGIVILKANSINGTGSVLANGNNAVNVSGQWSGGGGGAGGTVLITYTTIAGIINVNANGGAGGPAYWPNQVGPGGGGSGGVLWISAASLPGAITFANAGGLAGTWNNGGTDTWGATNGSNGMAVITSLAMPPQSAITPGYCAFLPVTWKSFYAEKNKNWAELVWKVASETNSEKYLILRSTDAEKWESIGEIKSKNSISGECKYTFTDKNPEQGINYYKIREIGADGKQDETSSVALYFKSEVPEFEIYPNPAINGVNVNFKTPLSGVKLLLLSAQGDLIREINASQQNTYINCETFSPGIYLIKSESQTKKFILIGN